MFFDTNFIIMVIVCVLVHVPDLLTSIPVCHNKQNPREALQDRVAASSNSFWIFYRGVETGIVYLFTLRCNFFSTLWSWEHKVLIACIKKTYSMFSRCQSLLEFKKNLFHFLVFLIIFPALSSYEISWF